MIEAVKGIGCRATNSVSIFKKSGNMNGRVESESQLSQDTRPASYPQYSRGMRLGNFHAACRCRYGPQNKYSVDL